MSSPVVEGPSLTHSLFPPTLVSLSCGNPFGSYAGWTEKRDEGVGALGLPPFHAWRSNPKSRKEGKGNVGPSLTGG